MTRFQLVVTAVIAAAFLLAAPLAAQAQAPPRSMSSEVLVVGGTPAGVAAALAAARRGRSVTLVSVDTDLGGILSGAMMDQWDLNLASDGSPIEAGIFGEMFGRLGEGFTPQMASEIFAQMVAAEPKITVWYDEIPIGVGKRPGPRGAAIDAVVFKDSRTGEPAIVRAPFVIDATDFGDIAALAGAQYDLGRQDSGLDERMQAVTLMFTVDGVDWPEIIASYDGRRFGPGSVTESAAWGYARVMRDYRPLSPDVLVRDLNLGRRPDGAVTLNAIDVIGVNGLDPNQLAQARRTTIGEAPHLLDFLRARIPGFERARIGDFAPEVYVRETRHVAGLERLTGEDVWSGRIPVDTIGLASYPLDVHPVDATSESAFPPVRHIYGIPFGTMVPRGFSNLLLASPAISATHLAAGSARIVPTTVEEGEAAGAAAALAARDGIDFVQLATQSERIAALREDLAGGGAIVDLASARRLALMKGPRLHRL